MDFSTPASPFTPTGTKPGARRFDLIAFDWDGTLFDSTQIIVRCIQAAVQDVGGAMPTREAASYVIGLGLMEALAHAAPDVPKEKYPALGARYRFHYMQKQDEIALFDGTLAMLQALKARGHLLAVATGKSRRGLDQALHSVDLHGLFHASRTADETEGKPHPLMLHELMAELGTSPQRTLMVGDTTHDLQMARAASTHAIGVTYGAHPRAQLAMLEPLALVDSVEALARWMGRR